MSAPAAKREISDFIDDLAIMRNTGRIDELRLKRIEQKIIELMQKNVEPPSSGHMVLGIVAAIRGNRVETEDHMRNAIRLEGNNYIILRNAFSALGPFGNFREALDLSQRALQLTAGRKNLLQDGISLSYQALQISRACSLANELEKLTVNDATASDPRLAMPLMMASLSAAERHGLSDEDLLARLEVAVDTVRAQSFEVRGTWVSTLGDGTLLHSLFVNADYKACAHLNFSIADALVEAFDDPGGEMLSIVSKPLENFFERRRT